MKIIRFIFPFLFARNWYNGAWEFSRARGLLFLTAFIFLILGTCIVYVLQTPVLYNM